MKQQEKIEISRPMVGVIALACLGGAIGLWIAYLTNPPENIKMLKAALTRVGLVMGALWIALPTKTREAAWANVSPTTFYGIVMAVIAFAAKPKLALYFVPPAIIIGILMVMLRPRDKKRPSDRAG